MSARMFKRSGARIDSLMTAQPTIWLPSGSPVLSCRAKALDRVTSVARMMSPIWGCCQLRWMMMDVELTTCVPTRSLSGPSRLGCLDSDRTTEKSERTKSSKRRYMIPRAAMEKPEAMLLKSDLDG